MIEMNVNCFQLRRNWKQHTVTDYHLWYGEKKNTAETLTRYTQESGLQIERKIKELSHFTEENQKYCTAYQVKKRRVQPSN